MLFNKQTKHSGSGGEGEEKVTEREREREERDSGRVVWKVSVGSLS